MSEATSLHSTCERSIEISTVLPQYIQATTSEQPSDGTKINTVSAPYQRASDRRRQFRRSTALRVVSRPFRLPQSARITVQTIQVPVQSERLPKPEYFSGTRKAVISISSIALTAVGMIVGAVIGYEGNVLSRSANKLSQQSLELAVWTAKKELRDYCERSIVSVSR